MLVPVFFAVSVVIFLILHLIPGDPIDNLIKIGSSPEQRAIITARYGLDRSLIEQYLIWLGNLLRGDLGTAIVAQRPVTTLIGQALPYSLALGGAALLFSTVLGIALGAAAAWRRDGLIDQTIMGGVLLGSTLPTFWLGLFDDPAVLGSAGVVPGVWGAQLERPRTSRPHRGTGRHGTGGTHHPRRDDRGRAS